MNSNFETGHAKNVAHFETLIAYCIGYGELYQPSKAALQIQALQQKLEEARATLAEVMLQLTNYNLSKNLRIETFAGLSVLATRIGNALAATDATEKTKEDVRAIVRKIKGIRISLKDDAALLKESSAETTSSEVTLYVTPADPAAANTPSTASNAMSSNRTHSAAQTSRDQLIEHFAKLLKLLEFEMYYQPNEVELQLQTLQQYLETLRTTNSAVINAAVALSNARILRNEALYADKTGLNRMAKEVKLYIKAAFGVKSPQYKQISKLRFTKAR